MKKLLIVGAMVVLSVAAEAGSAGRRSRMETREDLMEKPPYVVLGDAAMKLQSTVFDLSVVIGGFPVGSSEYKKALAWQNAVQKIVDEIKDNHAFYQHSANVLPVASRR